MSKKSMPLRVPPKFPKLYEIWTRDDGQQFSYSEKGWWVKVKDETDS